MIICSACTHEDINGLKPMQISVQYCEYHSWPYDQKRISSNTNVSVSSKQREKERKNERRKEKKASLHLSLYWWPVFNF